jgi:hypothetical protein
LDGTEDRVEEQFASEVPVPMPIAPSEGQMKELYQAWEKGSLLEALRERDRSDTD